MSKFILLLVAFLILGSIFPSSAQKATKTFAYPTPTPAPTPTPVPAPGNMQLLPDYVHVRKQGIDTAVGEISKTGGLVIRYDNGHLAGNVAWRMYKELPGRNVRVMWYREQKVNGLSLYLIRGEDKSIYATFPETCANFYSSYADEQALVDFLLMIVTYLKEPNKNVRMKDGRPTC